MPLQYALAIIKEASSKNGAPLEGATAFIRFIIGPTSENLFFSILFSPFTNIGQFLSFTYFTLHFLDFDRILGFFRRA